MIPVDKNRGLLAQGAFAGGNAAPPSSRQAFSSSAYNPPDSRSPGSMRRRPPAPPLHPDPEEPLVDSVRRAVEIHADKLWRG